MLGNVTVIYLQYFHFSVIVRLCQGYCCLMDIYYLHLLVNMLDFMVCICWLMCWIFIVCICWL